MQDSEAIRWLVWRNRLAPIRPPSPVGALLTDGEPEAPSPGAQSTAGDAARAPAVEVAPQRLHAPGTT
eukprot:5579261-Pyramimonas_sp.AAC.1